MLKFAQKVISSLIIISLVLMDVASCMEEPDQQQQKLLSTPLRIAPDQQPSSTDNSSSSHSSDRDSPPRQLVDSSSAPARLEGPPPSNNVVSSQQSRSASLPIAFQPVSSSPDDTEVLHPSPYLGAPRKSEVRLARIGSSLNRPLLSDPHSDSQYDSGGRLPRARGGHLRQFRLDERQALVQFESLVNKVRKHASASTRQFLSHTKKHIIEGELTGWQKASFVPALYIAAGTAAAAGLVLSRGVQPISDHLDNILIGGSARTLTVMGVVWVTQGLDALPRNASVLMRWVGPSKKAFQMVKEACHTWAIRGAQAVIYIGSTAVAVLPYYYFREAQNHVIQVVESQGEDPAPYEEFFDAFVGPYVINNIIFNGDPLAQKVEKKLDSHFYTALKQKKEHQRAEAYRKKWMKLLKDGELILDGLDLSYWYMPCGLCGYGRDIRCCCCEENFQGNSLILNELWEDVYARHDRLFSSAVVTRDLSSGKVFTHQEIRALQENEGILSENQRANLKEEERDALVERGQGRVLTQDERERLAQSVHQSKAVRDAEVLRIFLLLKNFAKQYKGRLLPEDSQEGISWWSKCLSGISTLLSAGKVYILYEAIDHFLSSGGWSGVLGVAGFAALSCIEWNAMDEFFFDTLGGKVISAARSHPWIRGFLNFINYTVLGPTYTLPYALLGLKYTEGWSTEARFTLLLFFCYADSFRNARMFRNPYEALVTLYDRVSAYFGNASDEYKRDKLKEIMRDCRTEYELLSHPVIEDLMAMDEEEEALEQRSDNRKIDVVVSPLAQNRDNPNASEQKKDSVDGKDGGDSSYNVSLENEPSASNSVSAQVVAVEQRPSSSSRVLQNSFQEGDHDAEIVLARTNSSPSYPRMAYTATLKLLYLIGWSYLLYLFIEQWGY